MARKRMVTRSFTTSKITCIVFNNETNATGKESFTLSGNFKTDAAAMKAVKEHFIDNEKIIPVKIVSIEEDTALYGMDENEFLAHAVKVDRSNKLIAEAPADAEAPATKKKSK